MQGVSNKDNRQVNNQNQIPNNNFFNQPNNNSIKIDEVRSIPINNDRNFNNNNNNFSVNPIINQNDPFQSGIRNNFHANELGQGYLQGNQNQNNNSKKDIISIDNNNKKELFDIGNNSQSNSNFNKNVFNEQSKKNSLNPFSQHFDDMHDGVSLKINKYLKNYKLLVYRMLPNM